MFGRSSVCGKSPQCASGRRQHTGQEVALPVFTVRLGDGSLWSQYVGFFAVRGCAVLNVANLAC